MNSNFARLIARASDLDESIINHAVHRYQERGNVTPVKVLREQALIRHPSLLVGSRSPPPDMEKLVGKHNLLHRSHFTTDTWEKIQSCRSDVGRLFPEPLFSLTHRVSTPPQAIIKEEENGIRARFDTVGFQVVPRHVEDIDLVIKIMEKQDVWPILFRFNTFGFSNEDFKILISPDSSSYYRAIHYYVNIGGVCAEIQLRTPAIDQWATLHQQTMYKKVVRTSKEEDVLIMDFGEMANWVDFYALSQR